MTVKARPRGLAHFRAAVRGFSDAVVEGKSRADVLASPSTNLQQDPAALREALEELRTHQEELAAADEEMRAQVEELARASARIHSERDRYHELFDVAPDPYFVTDRLGVVRDLNTAAAAMLGIEVRFLVGKPLAALVDPADTRPLRTALNTLRTEGATELELRFKPRGGQMVWHSLKGVNVEQNAAVLWMARDVHRYHEHAAILASSNEHLSQSVASRTNDLERANRDKDELLARERRLRTQLESEHVAKDRFLAVLSHDLRAPLNAVLGWTQLLRREKLDESARDRALATIERNARAQLRLVEELLDISRFAADKVQLERVPVDFRELVQRAAEGISVEARERKVDLECKLCAAPLVVAGDRRRLEQVMSNLLSNSLKFTPAGGVVRLTLDQDGSYARVVVEDTGRGIAPELLPHVWEPFRQANADYASMQNGLGLGLYIVRQAVEMHGGDVRAESTGSGKGASFVVRLPLSSADHPRHARGGEYAADATQRTPADTKTLQGLRVLVVDDEDDARELTAAILRQRGAIVSLVGDALAALHAVAVSCPDVIVSDVAMPGKSGLDLARDLRSSRTRPTLVALSGFTSPEEVETALDAGFDIHVAKPVEPQELVDALRDAARLRNT